jgi:hypothetical protein
MGAKARNLSTAVKAFLAAKGYFVWSGGCISRPIGNRWVRAGTVGGFDLYAIRPYKSKTVGLKIEYEHEISILGLELKASGDKISEAQRDFHEQFRQHGGTVIVARSLLDIIDVIP